MLYFLKLTRWCSSIALILFSCCSSLCFLKLCIIQFIFEFYQAPIVWNVCLYPVSWSFPREQFLDSPHRPSGPLPSYQFCTWIFNVRYVATALGPLACPSRSAWPRKCLHFFIWDSFPFMVKQMSFQILATFEHFLQVSIVFGSTPDQIQYSLTNTFFRSTQLSSWLLSQL